MVCIFGVIAYHLYFLLSGLFYTFQILIPYELYHVWAMYMTFYFKLLGMTCCLEYSIHSSLPWNAVFIILHLKNTCNHGHVSMNKCQTIFSGAILYMLYFLGSFLFEMLSAYIFIYSRWSYDCFCKNIY